MGDYGNLSCRSSRGLARTLYVHTLCSTCNRDPQVQSRALQRASGSTRTTARSSGPLQERSVEGRSWRASWSHGRSESVSRHSRERRVCLGRPQGAQSECPETASLGCLQCAIAGAAWTERMLTDAVQVDFHSLPADALRRYLVQADAMPLLFPSPCSTENPPLPSSLLAVQAPVPRVSTPVPTATPANRPKRDPKDASRRRSSRLQEEDARCRRAPILADAEAVHDVLATLSERHFEKQGIKEGDALQQFLLAVKTR